MSDSKQEGAASLPKPTVKVLRTGGEVDGLLQHKQPPHTHTTHTQTQKGKEAIQEGRWGGAWKFPNVNKNQPNKI